MFSFIKYLEGLSEKLKRNKGLWFTIITLVSIVGIIISLYVITTMTSNVSQKVYKSMAKDYNLKVDSFLKAKKNEFEKVALIYIQNKTALTWIENNDKLKIEEDLKKLNDSFVKKGVNNYKVKVYSLADKTNVLRTSVVSVVKSKNSIYGIEVMEDGVFNVYLQPLVKNSEVFGVFEIKESIHNYRKLFEDMSKEYAFLLDKNMLSKIAIESKNGVYRDLNEYYTLAQTFYDTKFAATITAINNDRFKQLNNDEYILDEDYYRMGRVITDINGANIGLMVLGETTAREDSFVKLADNMTKTVTTVALGLVISIMLFMF